MRGARPGAVGQSPAVEPQIDSLFGDLASSSPAELAQSLLPAALSGHFDEARGFTSPLPHIRPSASEADFDANWSRFFNELGADGLHTLPQHFDEVDRVIRDDGATYNVYARPDQPQRPWSLDLFPLILNPGDWAQIEAGVLQRTRLLNAILADVYGPQDLLHQALLPAALVRGHPGFIRAMQGTVVPDGTWLRIAAFDLIRAPDGQWQLLAQRTQAPSGLGYLLENRVTIARQFPRAFQALHVQRLAAAYTAVMTAMQQDAPAGEAPHIALLSPGPYSETYFEHAYLARYLGVTLVQGSDLTVRGERLFLKTVQGLQPVHGLIKRLDDAYLDPLELQADSALGVPGLLQAIRAGHVRMANMPGTGFLESPALLGFLPALSQQLLGEPLALPSPTSWWCGERPALESALPQLRELVIKPTVQGSALYPDFDTVFTDRLPPDELQAWVRRIWQNPGAHTLQHWAPASQMPSWVPDGRGQGHIGLKSVVLRVFALADGPNSWRVLPGGMARLAGDHASAAMRHGSSTADVWVRTQGAIDRSTRIEQAHQLSAMAPPPITSRVAENMFWLGRYTERAENSVRLAQLSLRSLEGEDLPTPELARWLAEMASRNGLLPDEAPNMRSGQLEQGLRVFERTLVNALNEGEQGPSNCLAGMRNAMQAVRERMSQEQWQLIAQTHDALRTGFAEAHTRLDEGGHSAAQSAMRVLADASAHLSAITGCQTDRMTRDSGWRLLFIGRLLERLSFLSQTLELALADQVLGEVEGFEAVMSLFDSTITFHARHQQRRNLVTLCDLLVLDDENPRALAWVIRSIRSHLDKLAALQGGSQPRLAELLPNPDHWDTLQLSTGEHTEAQLIDLLDQLGHVAWALSDAIASRTFTLSAPHAQSLMA